MTQPTVRGTPVPRNYFYELFDYPVEWVGLGVLIGMVIGVVATLLLIKANHKYKGV